MSELSRKKRVRAGHRASATKMISRTEELLAGDSPDVLKLSQLKLSLNEKLEVLKQLDNEILAMVDEGDVAGEIEQSDEFKEGIYAAMVGVERVLAPPTSTSTPPTPRSSAVVLDPSSVSSKVKLPRLTLQPFDGELTTWTPFWDSFKAAVHDNRALSDIDKFNYLRGLLQRTALEAISGLALTAANYQEAVSILEKRFGNKPQIVAKHMDVLIHVDAVSSPNNVKGLRSLYDLVESNVRSLRSLGVESASYGSLLASVLVAKIPQELQLIVSRKMGSDDWNLDALMVLLGEELQARERTAAVSVPSVKKNSKEPATAAALLTGGSNRITCSYCQQDHTSNSCGVVTQPHARKQVLQKAGRCFVCLRRGHISRECNSHRKCAKCGGRHHISICLRGTGPPPTWSGFTASDQDKTDNPSAASTQSRPDPPAAQRSGLNAGAPAFQAQERRSTSLWVNSGRTVLLQTAQAKAFNPVSPHQSRRVRIVLDSGSQRSYVTEHVARELSQAPEGKQPMTIMTFGTSEEQPQVCERVRLSLALKNGRTRQLTLFTVPIICEPLSCQPVSLCQDSFDHIMGLDLADPSNGRSRLEVDILIGSDQYWDLTTGETRRGRSGPVAINTELGWVLSGPAMSPDQIQPFTSLMTHTLRVDGQTLAVQALDDRLKSFWELESFGISPHSDTDPSVHEKFEGSVCFVDGRYQVELPWKKSHPPLADCYNLCLKRLRGLIRRLQQDPDVLREYDSTIKDQIQRGIVEPVEESSGDLCDKIHYLPHHAIIRSDKVTTKIRVVYDASAHSDGPSLNDCLHAGPKFDQKILDILLRFRVHRVAVTADIEKAFLMVAMAKKDRDVLRFLWFDDVFSDQPNVVQWRFTRVVFGVSSSPFLLNATIRHHLEWYREVQPRLVEKLSKAAYIDDIVTGADNEEEAHQLFTKSKEMLKEGGFHLRKFCSNSTLLQMKVEGQETLDKPAPTCTDETYASSTLGSGQSVRTGENKVLGVRWDLATDQLVMSLEDVASAASDLEPTKRAIVSLVGRISDPLGLLSPIVVQLKIFIQELCEAKLEWDQQLTGQLLERWHRLSSKLLEARPFLKPRCYLDGIHEQVTSYRLCGFSDASLKAYAAVVYFLVETPSGRHVRITASKTRVSPLKTQTIPRLELLSALLLARLMDCITRALEGELPLSEPHCFSDSTVAIFWIRGVEKTWKPFVQNRVLEIRKLLPPECWVHCSGRDNPADIPSRGHTPQQLADSQLWMNGPEWLKTGELSGPSELQMPEECQAEMKADKAHGLLAAVEPAGI